MYEGPKFVHTCWPDPFKIAIQWSEPQIFIRPKLIHVISMQSLAVRRKILIDQGGRLQYKGGCG